MLRLLRAVLRDCQRTHGLGAKGTHPPMGMSSVPRAKATHSDGCSQCSILRPDCSPLGVSPAGVVGASAGLPVDGDDVIGYDAQAGGSVA